ncbi:MAG: hypothetical protein LUE23_10790 [Lachnospiraceae bacterium]|nr:hypothetical protein [Lachnospiraceae bacterium]
MKKIKSGHAVLLVLFIVITVIAFVVPTTKTTTFWIAYIFTAIALIVQARTWGSSFEKNKSMKSKFMGLPVVYVSVMYLLAQIIAFAVFMAFPMLPSWSAIVVCVIIVGVFAINTITADVAIEEIERVEVKTQNKVSYLRNFQTNIELLAEEESDTEVQRALNQLAEKIRYSDPMSSNELEEIEESISAKVTDLQSSTDKMSLIKEVNALLNERNKKCKNLKYKGE